MPAVADGLGARAGLLAPAPAAAPAPGVAGGSSADVLFGPGPSPDLAGVGTDLSQMQMHDSNRFAMGMVTTLLLVCCLCLGGCSVYTCLRAWRRYHALSAPSEKDADLESALPNYTLVSGLPTYDEALDQLQQRRELRRSSSAQRAIELAVAAARAAGNLMAVKRLQMIRQLSVGELIQYSFRSSSSSEPFSKR